MAWQKDVNYSDSRHGVQKIITFPSVDVTATGVKGQITFNEDVRIQEVGSWVTTLISTTAPATVSIGASSASVATVLAIVSNPTTTDFEVVVGTEINQTTILNATALVSGSTLTVTTATAADDAGVITVYVKYLAEFN